MLTKFIGNKTPHRYAVLIWVAILFLLANTCVRLALVIFDADWNNAMPWRLLPILAIGVLYDLAALAYVLVPFALIALLWSNSAAGRRGHAISSSLVLIAGLVGMLFVALSEGVFWNEFSSRFNFIAVDYLIYTREVIGNIQQSYSVGWMLSGIGLLAVGLFFLLRKSYWKAATADARHFSHRLKLTGGLALMPVLSFFIVGDGPHELFSTPSARELSGNGYYEFMRAFRNNDLDFAAFYKVLPTAQAEAIVRAELDTGSGKSNQFVKTAYPIERQINAIGETKPYNVVLVSIESLGADFVESYGGKKGLTPNLVRLGREGLVFSKTFATGLRTVRGLEALTLSIPPTPGHAVPMRKYNKGFQTLGGVFKQQGYEPLYIYGGYSYFDNMGDFFGGNGYTVIDRSAVAAENISHETIWGVADEDMFRHTIKEMDERTAAGKKVFAHVMTTSNHRPFTYPANRIDIPSGTGRDGAVKYTDWAIGQFIKEASTKPWFNNTVFVLIADHTSNGRGRTDLPPENYHIPFIIYAPGIVAPGKVETIASQIDLAPTLLAMLSISYQSQFFGQDILTDGKRHQRAFMSNYLTVGYMEDGMVAELSLKRRTRMVDATTGKVMPAEDAHTKDIMIQAVSHFQLAADVLRSKEIGPVVAVH
jgi:phosphoglycerol transferase MdoB-like AlkP superfamily enzyme